MISLGHAKHVPGIFCSASARASHAQAWSKAKDYALSCMTSPSTTTSTAQHNRATLSAALPPLSLNTTPLSLDTKAASPLLLKIEELQSLIQRYEKSSPSPFFMAENLDFLKRLDNPKPSLGDIVYLLENSYHFKRIVEELDRNFRRSIYLEKIKLPEDRKLPDTQTAHHMRHLGQQLDLELEGYLIEGKEHIIQPIQKEIKQGNFQSICDLIKPLNSSPIIHCKPDPVDYLFDDIFNIGEGDPSGAGLSQQKVKLGNHAYMPTEISVVLYMLKQLNLTKDDVFVDIGTGLARIPILVSLLTAARAVGIECNSDFARAAQRTIKNYNLPRCNVRLEDATQSDFSEGSVFFLFNPFWGKVLDRVIESLKESAKEKALEGKQIRICSSGPCSQLFANQDWLEIAHRPMGSDTYMLTIFRSKTAIA